MSIQSNTLIACVLYCYLLILILHKRVVKRKHFERKVKHPIIQTRLCSKSSKCDSHTSFYKTLSNFKTHHKQMEVVANVAFSIGYNSTNTDELSLPPASVRWDTDSILIRVDNCCTRSISFDVRDFDPSTLQDAPERLVVSGFVSETNTPITKIGTIVWKIVDDDGNNQEITIPNSYLVPGGSSRLLSPQHWAQEADDHHPSPHGTSCITTTDSIILQWKQAKYKKTMKLNPTGNNVGTIWSVPGYHTANTIADCVQTHFAHVCFNSEIIQVVEPDPYDNTIDDEGITIEPPDAAVVQKPVPAEDIILNDMKQGTINPFLNDVEYQLAMTQREQPTVHSPDPFQTDTVHEIINQRELLSWHYRLGHLSMNKVQRLASIGLLPSKIATCKIPVCKSCMYGMLTKQPWRTKADIKQIAPTVTYPCEHISVDQLESPVPGLVGQLKGKPTLARYRFATVFVDSFSRASYVYLQQTSNAAETLEAKKQFESYAKTHNVHIKHYHADNGRFIGTAWQDHAKLMGQSLSYAGVGAHHQNGIAEKRIRDLQDLARSSLIHAIKRWPDAINTHLWPYEQLHKSNSP
jgi:GAG-pre-integrase domain